MGRLGCVSFPRATYAYVGLAMNGLRARLAHHLRGEKKLHWHIDYLLKEAEVEEIIICQSEERVECSLSQALSRKLQYVPDLGSSDCKCWSHLYFTREKDKLKTSITEAVKQAGLAYEISPKGVNGNVTRI